MSKTTGEVVITSGTRAIRQMWLAIVIASLCLCVGVEAEPVHLKWVETGAGGRMTSVQPHRIDLSDRKPAEIKRLPADVTAPLYGVLSVGPAESISQVAVLLDAPEGKPSRLFVDANGDGDFTNDPLPRWESKPYPGQEGKIFTQFIGNVAVPVLYGKTKLPLHFTLQRYDPADPARTGFKGAILYSPDYAREGEIKFGAKAYHAMLLDAIVGGDFRGLTNAGTTGIFLLIDLNGNGVFDSRGEIYDVGQPFNIGGTTYEIHGLTASAEAFDLVKSAKKVAEILPPPDLRVGHVVPAFEKKATDGTTIRFPQDYRGKLVLLYFWATWCGVCNREMPTVAKAYEALHPLGLEMVGVSLDHENAATVLADYTHQHGMPWAEIYDGKWMQADLAQLYYVQHTPTPILVDGDTGKVLAIGPDLRGDRLNATLADALKTHKAR